jgi:hypothetical protein
LKGKKDKFARSLFITLSDSGYATIQQLHGHTVTGTLANAKMYHFDTSAAFKSLVLFLACLDSVSHVIIWTVERQITRIECPRLDLRFSVHKDGRIMLEDHDDMCMCLSPPSALLQLLPDGTESRVVILENSQGHYFFLIPNFGLQRRVVKACPFYNIPNTVRSRTWFDVMRKHYFLYPVHPSFSYLEQVFLSCFIYARNLFTNV